MVAQLPPKPLTLLMSSQACCSSSHPPYSLTQKSPPQPLPSLIQPLASASPPFTPSSVGQNSADGVARRPDALQRSEKHEVSTPYTRARRNQTHDVSVTYKNILSRGGGGQKKKFSVSRIKGHPNQPPVNVCQDAWKET